MTTLVCDSVSVRFGAVIALHGVSFAALPGSVTAVVGANGAGKTTLLNVLSGHLRPSRGIVRLGDEIINTKPRHILARLGIFRSFQHGQLFETLTVTENLTAAFRPVPDESLFGALKPQWQSDPLGICRDRVISRAARATGICAYQDRPAAELSYGLRKRAILAQAVIADSVICLLDEPLAGVDPKSRHQVLDLITRLRDPGRIIVVVEHDLDTVRLIADRVLVFDRGRIVSDGAPDKIYPSEIPLFAPINAE